MKWLIVLAVVITAAGCSSSPKKVAGQFCHTKKIVEVDNGSDVLSKTTVIPPTIPLI